LWFELLDAGGSREVRELFAGVVHPLAMENHSLSDAELVALATDGQVEGLAALLDRYRPSLYAAAIGLLRNREDALDAVQDTFITTMVRLGSVRDPDAVGGWMHRVVRNECLLRLRRARHRSGVDDSVNIVVPAVEEAVDALLLRDWVWSAIDALAVEDRVTVMLRYFSRCHSYDAIADATGVPVGTVRSRLNRSRAQLSHHLLLRVAGSELSHAVREREQRAEWEGFYRNLHDAPEPRSYRDTYAPDVQVTDGIGSWRGLTDWSAHERDAITLGVRASIVGLVAGEDLTILEIDFHNPASASDHCPPRSTFVHRLSSGRSRRLDIHYV
jgi:RNA polymerase sigma factor (sigma-70 family)